MVTSASPDDAENYGPEAALRLLEAQGLGDGPLAKAFRAALARKPNGSLAVGGTFLGPDAPAHDDRGEAV